MVAVTTTAALTHESQLADAYAEAEADVRRLDKDRYLASLFVPDTKRGHVLAILAFSAEIARVRDVVSDPLPGEIRLQWWRDLLQNPELNGVNAPPMARALIDTIARFHLPAAALVRLIDARVFDLYDDPMPDLHELEGYCGDTVSALIQLSAIILTDGSDPGTAEIAGHAGVAYGLTGLLRALPFHAARGQIYMPADALARHGVDIADILAGRSSPGLIGALSDLRATARHHLRETHRLIEAVPPPVRSAFLHLALVEPMLRAMDRRDYDPFRTPVDSPQWLKQARLWWAAWRG